LLLEQLDLGADRARIGGIALKHPHRQGLAVGTAQQANDNLPFAFFTVTVVAIVG